MDKENKNSKIIKWVVCIILIALIVCVIIFSNNNKNETNTNNEPIVQDPITSNDENIIEPQDNTDDNPKATIETPSDTDSDVVTSGNHTF